MTNPTHTSFVGRHTFTTKDRDGYDEDVFDIDILLRFYADGIVHGVEDEGRQYSVDDDISSDHDFEGKWSADSDKMIVFNLKRVRPARETTNEIPGDGSNYYAYPTSASVSHLSEGTYSSLCVGDRLLFLSEATSKQTTSPFSLLGEMPPDFPFYKSLPKVSNPKEWATFQYGPYTETHQWTPEDEPREVSSGFCVRMHRKQNRVEIDFTEEHQFHDLLPYRYTLLSGTWEHHPGKGYLLDLQKSDEELSDYQWPLKAAKYWANFYNGQLCLEPIRENNYDRGRESSFYDLPPIDPESVWLETVADDPLAALRDPVDKKEEGAQSSGSDEEVDGEKETADAKQSGEETLEFFDKEPVKTVIGVIFWIVVIWLIVTWLN